MQFLTTFSNEFGNQREVLRFFDTHIEFLKKKKFFALTVLALFENFEAKRAKKTFFVNVSEISILHPSKGLYSSFSKI